MLAKWITLNIRIKDQGWTWFSQQDQMICKIEISVSRGPLGMSDHTIIEMETL